MGVMEKWRRDIHHIRKWGTGIVRIETDRKKGGPTRTKQDATPAGS